MSSFGDTIIFPNGNIMVSDLEALSRAITAAGHAEENELYALILKDRARIEEELIRDGQSIIVFRGTAFKVTRKV